MLTFKITNTVMIYAQFTSHLNVVLVKVVTSHLVGFVVPCNLLHLRLEAEEVVYFGFGVQ